MGKIVNAAIAQHPPVFLNIKATIEKAVELINEAAKNNVELLAFPETWLPGYPVWLDSAPNAAIWDEPAAKKLHAMLHANSLEIGSDGFITLQKAAKDANMVVIMGANEKRKRTIYNTILMFHPDGKIYQIHRKLVPTFTERLVWGRGDGSTLSYLETDFGNISALVCWEHWMPFARAIMHSHNEVLHIAQWPTVHEIHNVASRQYAFEGQCYVLACGSVLTKKQILDGAASHGKLDDDVYDLLNSIPDRKAPQYGGSCIIAPDMSYVTEPVFDKEDFVCGELDIDKVFEGNITLDTDGHYSRPDIFTLKVDTSEHKNIEVIK
jgi:nitrilase